MANENFGTVFTNALRRVTRSNFQTEKATDAERERLAAAKTPVTDPLAQDYAAWRRGVLMIGAIAVAIWAFIELGTFEETAEKMKALAIKAGEAQVGRKLVEHEREQVLQKVDQEIRKYGADNFELIDNVKMMIAFSILIGAIFIGMAAKNWHRVKASRRWARTAFYVIFLTPFAMAAIPFTAVMDFEHLSALSKKQVTIMLGLDLGFYLFMLVGPRALALFPGVVRSSVTLKTLIPESPLTGWAATIMSLFYPIFLIVIVAFLNQITGNMVLLGGILCLIIAPLVYIANAKQLMRPHSEEEVQKFVVGVRLKVVLFNIAGAALLGYFLFDLSFFTAGDAVRFLASFIGNFMLVTLVASDLILALLRAGHEQTMEFKGTELAKNLDRKFAGLAGVGLTDIKAEKEDAAS